MAHLMISGKPPPFYRATLHRACKEHILQHAALCPSIRGVSVKPHMPVITRTITPCRPEHSIAATMLLWPQGVKGKALESAIL
ncbi:jg5867 [Pararge aegeria aegeria]|uniref:Jg5867 protein n=1 Tax=Pararge aegeria aegeria TaxID=348720 RepID=A0A8S4RGB5_9NEOP|nr:jg5867 [Pararge aegeria aegeria]